MIRHFFGAVLLAALVAMAGTAAAREVPSLISVPERFADPRFSELTRERRGLRERLQELKQDSAAFNNECASVDQGSSAAMECRRSLAKLERYLSFYIRDAKRFNRAVTAAAAQQCPAGAYETRRRKTREGETLACECRFGFEKSPDGCRRTVSGAVLDTLLPMVTLRRHGDVRAAIVSVPGGTDLSLAYGVQGNWFKTGAKSFITFDLLIGRELTIGMNTELKLSYTEESVAIEHLKGSIRFSGRKRESLLSEQMRKARYYFGKSKAWLKRATQRRFRVRTPTAAVAVRGTDFVIASTPDGGHRLTVLSGKVDVADKAGNPLFTLASGGRAALPPDGPPRALESASVQSLMRRWRRESGVPAGD